ncbi:uncharacterized protein B0P05DRAFT_634931 [Gilbertella persicaria]|uniref:PH domain-containing protein n=1 Tax=Rhizopus stolonifer TaxID=4846 RepID=A0A367KSE8_RHIST|nr:uncharacterized protein B0P05DRAFT_634931 [Gilbertella persicaria]KAI8090176.1 hypothetical protein B0P05DRAFT_634931 [Gilbertella persicaria]RCI05060.1 hypothetical protein CU098_012781 [Rhizopus stolonifer]
MSVLSSPAIAQHDMQTLFSKRRWVRGPRTNLITPLKVSMPHSGEQEKTLNQSSGTTTAVGSPSSVKILFPSLSMFNLPTMLHGTSPMSPLPPPPPALSLPPTTANPEFSSPPPQFAVDYKRPRFFKKPKLRKRRIQKGYPSAFETFLFDDTLPGIPNKGIRPVSLLIERLEAWYLLAKRLLHHFELLASVETKVAKNYRKLEYMTIFPTADKHDQYRKDLRPINFYKRQQRALYKDQRLLQIHFAFQGGIRSVCDAWQNYHTNTTKDHAEFATFLRNEAIPTLSNIKRELKWMIKSIRADDRLSLVTLTNLKREAAKRLKRLDRQLVFFDQYPYHGHSKRDPWLVNAAVVKQMIKVYCQENKIHETVLRLQRETLISEEHLVEEFRRLCQHIYKMRDQSSLGVDRGLERIMSIFDKIQMDSDWLNFSQHHQTHLVSESAAFRHPDHLQYPNHSHILLQPIFAARMERRSRILHHWHEYIYVLTPAGFLHEYRTTQHYPAHPDATIFVPHYKVSSLATNLHHNLIFQLQPHAASRNLLQHHHEVLPKQWRTSKQRWGLHDRMTWTLRAKSAADMETWLHHLTESSERYRPTTVNVLAYSNVVLPEIVVDSTEESEVKEEQEKKEEEKEQVIETSDEVPAVEEDSAPVETETEEVAASEPVVTDPVVAEEEKEAPAEDAETTEPEPIASEEPPAVEEATSTEEVAEPVDDAVVE